MLKKDVADEAVGKVGKENASDDEYTHEQADNASTETEDDEDSNGEPEKDDEVIVLI